MKKTLMLTMRLPPEIASAAQSKADESGISIRHWVRGLIEKETGIQADTSQGFAAVSAKKLKAAVTKSHKSRAKNKKKSD